MSVVSMLVRGSRALSSRAVDDEDDEFADPGDDELSDGPASPARRAASRPMVLYIDLDDDDAEAAPPGAEPARGAPAAAALHAALGLVLRSGFLASITLRAALLAPPKLSARAGRADAPLGRRVRVVAASADARPPATALERERERGREKDD